MGLFNHFYGRSYEDRRQQQSSHNSRRQQLRCGGNNSSGGSSATSSPEPIDFSVNDIVFDRKMTPPPTPLVGGGHVTGRGGRSQVDWRQNDIDFRQFSQQQWKQRGSVSSDDAGDNCYAAAGYQPGQYYNHTPTPPPAAHDSSSCYGDGGYSSYARQPDLGYSIIISELQQAVESYNSTYNRQVP